MEENEPKARQACINCRRQKMKCRIEDDNTCRRCRRAGLPCVFVPRANASAVMIPASLAFADLAPSAATSDLLRRVKAIEDHLGLSRPSEVEVEDIDVDAAAVEDSLDEDDCLSGLWQAMECLERNTPGPANPQLWRRRTIKHLWQTFNENMPGLHFLPRRLEFTSPHPLLLASILYCSSARGAPNLADMSPLYFSVLCNAIAQLSVPNSDIGRPPEAANACEEWAFQTVLGLVLAGLLSEANIRETGIWIAIAYRLIVEYCPPHIDEKRRDWRKLFQGVQIVDLEHASLYMLSPAIPIEPPLPSLQISQRDQLHRLSRMMHAGLAHFSGRGLPAIWSCFSGNQAQETVSEPTCLFTAVDAAVIRDWARQLDDWLTQFSKASDESEEQRTSVFRQYVLHRLVVLSIYHPARGFDLTSNTITPQEQHELLLSARATIKLHLNDKLIWSNWDLVIITWAALIVLQAVERGAGEADDLRNIRIHLDMLRRTNEPKPSLRDKLAKRLEDTLQGLQTPSPTALNTFHAMNQELDYSWQIFDQASLEQILSPAWAASAELQSM